MYSETDRVIVDWIGRLGAAGSEHVMRLLGTGRRRASGQLGRLDAAGLLEQPTVLHRRTGLYAASAPGLRWCGLAHLGVHRVGPGGAAHARALASAAVELRAGLPGWRILSARDPGWPQQGPARRLRSERAGEGRQRRPDLLVVSPEGRADAVQLELSRLGAGRVDPICSDCIQAGIVKHVYCLAAPAAAAAIQLWVSRQPTRDRITVLELGEVPRLAPRVADASGASSSVKAHGVSFMTGGLLSAVTGGCGV